MESVAARAWRKLHQPRVYFTVEPILLIFMFASFLSYSVFQQLVHRMVCHQTLNCSDDGAGEVGNGTSDQECFVMSDVQQTVQSRSSHWLLYINLASGLPSIFLSMLYGSLSDLLGRKTFIALPPIGSIVNTAVILLVVYLEDTLPIAFFLLGAFASGLFGNFSVLNFGVYSYASDISVRSKRTVQIGVLESMTYLGATLSLLIGGVWIQSGKFGPPFWCILCCQLAVIFYIVVFLPESLGSRTSSARSDGINIQQKNKYKRRQSCTQLLKSIPYNLFNFGKMVLGSWRLLVLMLTFFVVEINFLGITDIVILYAIGEPLCWSSAWIGYFLALKVFLNGLAALILLPVLVYVRVPDTVIILAGLAAGAASLVVMGVAVKTWIMFIVPVIAAMRGCVVPVIRSMLSKNTPPDKQGILFSGVGVVESTCTMAASVIYNALYPATRQVHHGFCFFLMAGTLAIPFVLILILHFKKDQSHNPTLVDVSDDKEEARSLLHPSTSYNST